MFRKILAIAILAIVGISLLPAIASAAVTGTAALTAGQNVFPGTRDFRINVTNSNMPLIGTRGRTTCRSSSPTRRGSRPSRGRRRRRTGRSRPPPRRPSTATCSAPAAPTPGSTPGAALAFDFKSLVAAPAATDRAGEFNVFVSDDAGATTKRLTGALTSTVRILEILERRPRSSPGRRRRHRDLRPDPHLRRQRQEPRDGRRPGHRHPDQGRRGREQRPRLHRRRRHSHLLGPRDPRQRHRQPQRHLRGRRDRPRRRRRQRQQRHHGPGRPVAGHRACDASARAASAPTPRSSTRSASPPRSPAPAPPASP